MVSRKAMHRLTAGFLLTATLLCMVPGCAHKQISYKADADRRVYAIIDQKWDPNFGPKANYKISDTAPSVDDVQVERAVPASGTITIAQAVALATAHNRDYQTQKEQLYVRALDLRLTRHQFESQFFGVVSGGDAGDQNDEVAGVESRVGFSRLLSTGTQVGLDIAGIWADVLTGNLSGGFSSVLSATVTQPLLRGRARRVVLESLTQAERDTLYEIRTFNRFRKIFVVAVISEHLRVLELREKIRYAEENHETLGQLYEHAQTLAGLGRIPRYELDRIAQDRLQAWQLYLQAHKEYASAFDRFKITLGLPTTSQFVLDLGEMETLKARPMELPDFAEEEAIHAALCRRLDLANSADAIIDAQRMIFVTADGLKTDLNLIAFSRIPTARRADRGTLGWLREEYGVGFELSLPLDRVAEQNFYRKALIALSQAERNYELAVDTITLDIRQAYRDLAEAAERYRVSVEALDLARRRFDDTFLMLKYRRASTRRVLDAQGDLLDAQNAAVTALMDYTIATLNFYRDTGVLQVKPDGMWELQQPAAPLTASSVETH